MTVTKEKGSEKEGRENSIPALKFQ